MLNKTVCWDIGDGQTINIWQHRWAPYTWSNKPYTPKPNRPHKTTISEFIDAYIGTWDITELQAHFLSMDVQEILEIPLEYLNRPDLPLWKHHPRGIFTVSSTYHAFKDTTSEQPQSSSQQEQTHIFYIRFWQIKQNKRINGEQSQNPMEIARVSKDFLHLIDSAAEEYQHMKLI
ncbi:hypothetical protein LIER_21559 [Lithospermum erythrorhizon]|uniref:Uncharacterized protein n=1 Tax=Lithospermum erythrorhizon TaxID=34254 RepID=A0AAV3QQN0_LITER